MSPELTIPDQNVMKFFFLPFIIVCRGDVQKNRRPRANNNFTPSKEKAFKKYLKGISDFRNPVRIKFVPFLAFVIARQRSTIGKPINPPGKNWAQGFVRRHLVLKLRRVRAIDKKRYENNIYNKIIHWFDVIGKVLRDPVILLENVYNMDKTGVILCILGFVKVLISKNDLRDYRGAGVKRTMVTAIECISVDGRSLLSMIIWPAVTH